MDSRFFWLVIDGAIENINGVFKLFNFGATKNKMYTVFDIDTGSSSPAVTLEVYRVGEGRIERRAFTWDEILGRTKIKPLPSPPAKSAGSKPPAAPAATKTQK